MNRGGAQHDEGRAAGGGVEAWTTAEGVARLAVRAPDGEYDVLVGRGLLRRIGKELVERGLRGPVAVITDEEVGPRHAPTVKASLEAAGLDSYVVTLPAGESAKTLETVRQAYDALLALRLGRDTTVVALGGGVIGDMVGFVAATYLRGVQFVQAPTTVLSMVDASVGGKVGVDMPQGKNLIGAFKTPRLVLADLDTLETLPPEEVRAGLAEVVKAGIIDDVELFEHLEAQGAEPLTWTIPRAILVKQRVVEDDPYEAGRRAVLNLGHTFGHAFETVMNYELRHGEGVAIGMAAAMRLAVDMGLADAALEQRVRGVLTRLGLPVALPGVAVDAVWAAMAFDKKREAGRVRFILARGLGDVDIFADVPPQLVRAAIAAVTTD